MIVFPYKRIILESISDKVTVNMELYSLFSKILNFLCNKYKDYAILTLYYSYFYITVNFKENKIFNASLYTNLPFIGMVGIKLPSYLYKHFFGDYFGFNN